MTPKQYFRASLCLLLGFAQGCSATGAERIETTPVEPPPVDDVRDGPEGRWVRTFHGRYEVTLDAVAASPDGAATVAGRFGPGPIFGSRGPTEDIDLDPGAATTGGVSAGYYDAFVARLDAAGELLWAHAFGGVNFEIPEAVAVAPDGSVVVVGTFDGTGGFDDHQPDVAVDLNPGRGVERRTSVGAEDVFVLCLGPEGGFRWVRTFGGPQDDWAHDVAVASDGSAIVVGNFSGSVDFDPGPSVVEHVSSESWGAAYILSLDAGGEHRWSRSHEGPSMSCAEGVAVDDDGALFIVGSIQGRVDLDPGPSVDERHATGTYAAYVSHFDAEGGHLWTRLFTSPRWVRTGAVAVVGDGAAAVAGWFDGEATFCEGCEPSGSQGGEDAFVLRLDREGDLEWVQTLGGAENDYGFDVAAMDDESVLLAGRFHDGDSSAGDRVTAILAIFRGSGEPGGTWSVEGGGSLSGRAVDVGPEGTVFVAGRFEGSVDFAPGPASDDYRTEAGVPAGFVSRLTSGLREISRRGSDRDPAP